MTPNELYHHGIKGQKWGIRRFQNPDGSLTPSGKKRYGVSGGKMEISSKDSKPTQKVKNDWNTMTDKEFLQTHSVSKKRYAKRVNKYGDPYKHAKDSKATQQVIKTGKKMIDARERTIETSNRAASNLKKVAGYTTAAALASGVITAGAMAASKSSVRKARNQQVDDWFLGEHRATMDEIRRRINTINV